MREEVIRKARKRGGSVYCFFDKTGSRRVTRSSNKGRSDGPLIIPVTIDARSRVTSFMVGEQRTKPVLKQASFEFCCVAELPPFWATSREKRANGRIGAVVKRQDEVEENRFVSFDFVKRNGNRYRGIYIIYIILCRFCLDSIPF